MNNRDLKNAMQLLPQGLMGLIPNFCDRCGVKHEREELEVITQDQEKASFKLRCRNCGNTYMIQVTSPMEGVMAAKRLPFKMDISKGEFSKFSESKKIETDEILDVYNSLENVSTLQDFDLLFRIEADSGRDI